MNDRSLQKTGLKYEWIFQALFIPILLFGAWVGYEMLHSDSKPLRELSITAMFAIIYFVSGFVCLIIKWLEKPSGTILPILLLIFLVTGCASIKPHEVIKFNQYTKSTEMDVCGFDFNFYKMRDYVKISVSSKADDGTLTVFIWDESDGNKGFIFDHTSGQKIDSDSTSLPLGHIMTIDVYKKDPPSETFKPCAERVVKFQ